MNQKVATYQEIRRYWDINEVVQANEWLDIREDMEWMASEELKARTRTRGR